MTIVLGGFASHSPAHAGEWTARFLPEKRIFQPFIADPNERQMSAEYVWADKGPVQNFLLHLGTTIPLVTLRPPEAAKDGDLIQIGIDGGAFLVIAGRDNFPLQVTDFQAGVPLDYRTGPLALRLRYVHLSSHLGDDYINRHPYDPRDKATTESAEIFASYDLSRARLYGGAAYAFHSVPAGGARLQVGLEMESRPLWRDFLSAYFAADLQSKEENDFFLDEDVQAGLVLRAASGRAIRFGLTFFNGYAPLRQFVRDRARWYGLGLYYAPRGAL